MANENLLFLFRFLNVLILYAWSVYILYTHASWVNIEEAIRMLYRNELIAWMKYLRNPMRKTQLEDGHNTQTRFSVYV